MGWTQGGFEGGYVRNLSDIQAEVSSRQLDIHTWSSKKSSGLGVETLESSSIYEKRALNNNKYFPLLKET